MKPERLNHIVAEVRKVHRWLSKPSRNGGHSIKRNLLPKVTFDEHKALCAKYPAIAALTRSFDYAETEYVEPNLLGRVTIGNRTLLTGHLSPARRPIVREIWVGARSLACTGEDELPEGHQRSQIEHEDSAELTDLVTMLYDDPKGFDEWLEREITRRITENRGSKWVKNRIMRMAYRKYVLDDCPRHVKTGEVVKCMITDDETGELRPIRYGDTITTAHGSNEDLDALYLDEVPDPRSEDDSTLRELLRDRVNANSDFEQDMLNDPGMALASKDDEFADNDVYLRRVANHLASRLIDRRPTLQDKFLELRELAYLKVQRMHSALKVGTEGKLIAGQWNRPKDHWDEQESRMRTLQARLAKRFTRRVRIGSEDMTFHVTKQAPAAVNWDDIRTPQEFLTRSELMADLNAR
jgi:hypothetical protein